MSTTTPLTSHSTSPPSRLFKLQSISSAILGVVTLIWVLWNSFYFPVLPIVLCTALIIYGVSLLILPWLWIFILPLVTICLDLTTYSGRAILNELDYFILLTVAVALLCCRLDFQHLARRSMLFTVATVVAVVISIQAWEILTFSRQPLFSNPYYLPAYGVKTWKGLIYGFLLIPLVSFQYQASAARFKQRLFLSSVLSSICFLLIISWERGLIQHFLSEKSGFQFLSELINFSGSYRTTGIFSDMHTGGEVVDGVLLCLLPLVMYGLSKAKYQDKALAIIGLMGLGYIMLAGITRATYVSFFLSLLLFSALYAKTQFKRGIDANLIPAGLVCLLTGFGLYKVNGNYGMLVFMAILFLCTVFHLGQTKLPVLVRIFLLSLSMAGVAAYSVFTLITHPWVESSGFNFMLLGAVWIALVPAALVLGRSISGQSLRTILFTTTCLIVFLFLMTQALGGSKINQRLETAAKDMGTRIDHWQKVVASGKHDLRTFLFGNPPGSFPLNYLLTYPDTVADVGSFRIDKDPLGDNVLNISGGHDLAFGQRVKIEPYQDYQVRLVAKADQDVGLGLFFCERNLIFADNFVPRCSIKSVKVAQGSEYSEFSFLLKSKNVGDRRLIERWPTTFYIKNTSPDSTLQVKRIELISNGFQVFENADFSLGLDHWFFYNDFAHLPWHIKNTFLHIYYDFGIIGLLVFGAFFILAIRSALMLAKTDLLAPSIVCGLIGFCAFGLLGTPLDSPRVGWLFYFLLFFVVLVPPSELRKLPA